MKTNARTLVLSLAAMAGLVAACPAAASITFGNGTVVTAPGTIAVSGSFSSGQTLDLGAAVLNISAATPVSFYDNFVFTVGAGQSVTLTEAPLTVQASISVLGSTVTLASFTGSTSNLSGITDTLYAGTPTVGAQLGGSNPDTSALTALPLSTVLGPGTYTLEVSGSDTGKSTLTNLTGGLGVFAQQVKFTSTVPEPATTALMLAGMTLLAGLAVRRRTALKPLKS